MHACLEAAAAWYHNSTIADSHCSLGRLELKPMQSARIDRNFQRVAITTPLCRQPEVIIFQLDYHLLFSSSLACSFHTWSLPVLNERDNSSGDISIKKKYKSSVWINSKGISNGRDISTTIGVVGSFFSKNGYCLLRVDFFSPEKCRVN